MTSPPILLTEGGPPQQVSLAPREYAALRRLGIVEVHPTLEPGLFEISAGRKIGAVSVGERQVVVRPKIADLNRLVFLLGYSLHRDFWRDDRVHLAEADELLPALAEAFARLASRATEQGLLQGYRTISDDLPVLRGRILAGEQMTRNYGLPVPLAVEYDEFTVDIAENQILLSAVLRLLTIPQLPVHARRRLQRLRVVLADVTSLGRGTALPAWQPTRLNARYHDAIRLAEIVLSAQSFEHHSGDLAVTGFMFDMWRIFEDFVCTALGEALDRREGRHEKQPSLYLDASRNIRVQPDLVWIDSDGRVRAVVDAKYKSERPAGFPDADLYQMLAYCTVLGLQDGYLIYARGNEAAREHIVQRGGQRLHCLALDLRQSPVLLLDQVRSVAELLTHKSIPGDEEGRNGYS
ncbi:restriction endonuclease [Streptomyces sp. SID6673]|nr:restriction endonuclease [Streptomyces sp. SID11726]NEB26580.1 restriction endonuclease [Streptomyces sp. SID6673]